MIILKVIDVLTDLQVSQNVRAGMAMALISIDEIDFELPVLVPTNYNNNIDGSIVHI